MKRNIGHLCHDEPRESVKKSKSEPEGTPIEGESSNNGGKPSDPVPNAVSQQSNVPDAALSLAPPPVPGRVGPAPSSTQQNPVSAPQLNPLAAGNPSSKLHTLSSLLNLSLINTQVLNYDDLFSSSSQSQNNFQDMHQFHPSYMFNTSEVNNEYNLLNDFLNNNLMDDGAFYGGNDFHTLFSDASLMNPMGNLNNDTTFDPSAARNSQLLPPPAQSTGKQPAQRRSSGFPIDKARAKYFMTAADPAGSAADSPEERMNKLLKAKMDAGLLKPFNYVKGYARLNQYMEQNLQQISRVRVLRQLDRFRPKFRERMEKLTDVDLVRIEMWFDKSLMEYDRVFASMAIPACCWRRTGEIYRGNKEMARLIHVPMSKLRDVRLLHHFISHPTD